MMDRIQDYYGTQFSKNYDNKNPNFRKMYKQFIKDHPQEFLYLMQTGRLKTSKFPQ